MIIALSVMLIIVSAICIHLKSKLEKTERCLLALLNDLQQNGKLVFEEVEEDVKN